MRSTPPIYELHTNLTIGMSSWIRGERAKVVAEYQLSEEEEHPKICELCHEEGQEGLTEIPGCKHLFCDFCLNVDEAIELSEEGREVSSDIGRF